MPPSKGLPQIGDLIELRRDGEPWEAEEKVPVADLRIILYDYEQDMYCCDVEETYCDLYIVNTFVLLRADENGNYWIHELVRTEEDEDET